MNKTNLNIPEILMEKENIKLFEKYCKEETKMLYEKQEEGHLMEVILVHSPKLPCKRINFQYQKRRRSIKP